MAQESRNVLYTYRGSQGPIGFNYTVLADGKLAFTVSNCNALMVERIVGALNDVQSIPDDEEE